jgi:TRAP transporter TAXI family solute receptor
MKYRLAGRSVVIAILALIGLTVSLAQGWPRFVSIGTASPAGAYYPLGVAMADLWNRNIDGVRFSSQETGGSVANMNMLASGDIEVGIANENIAWNATEGNEPFPRPIDVDLGWVLNKSMGLFVAQRDSRLRTVEDLRGKRISLGTPGSSANVLGARVLESQGLTEGDYEAVYMGWQESADAMNDGFIDAAFMVGGQPFPAIESLAVRTPITILDFDAQRLAELPGFPLSTGTIPADMYDTEDDAQAVQVRSINYVDPELPEDLVYEMVKTVFDNIDALKAAHSSGDQAELLTPQDAEALGIEIHPGVVRYAQEAGAWED